MAGWAANALAAGRLSSGRFQFWACDGTGQIFSSWNRPATDDWVYWRKPWTPALPPFTSKNLAVAPLSDARLQFWAVDTTGAMWSCWQSTTASNAPWTPWTKSWTPSAPPFTATQVASAPLSDGRLQFWAVDTAGVIWSATKSTTVSNAPWTEWTNAWTAKPPFTAAQVAAAPLSDGRLQFWAVDTAGVIWSCWKTTTASTAPWSAWTKSWTPAAPPFVAAEVTAGQLSDGRVQFFAVDTTGAIWSCWKSTTVSNSPWTAWTKNWINDLPSFTTTHITAARGGDGRLEVWVIDTTGQIRTTLKSTAVSTAAWQNWALMFNMQMQEQVNWCWAGCAAGTSHFYDPNSTWSQCLIANADLGVPNCCTDPASCDVYGYLWQSLTTVGHFDREIAGTTPQATITSETLASRPVGVRIAWKGGGAHFIFVAGGGAGGMVTIEDPWYGYSYIPYATLVSGYQSIGSWTDTYFTN